MPKEKATTRKAAKGKADGGKKKKGNHLRVFSLLPITNFAPDPNMPKRGLSAYMFFANDQRDKVREDNPGIKFGISLSVTFAVITLMQPRRSRQDPWGEVEGSHREAEDSV
jgi:hypothetical protein